MSMHRAAFGLLLALSLLVGCRRNESNGRVIVLGLDGVDPDTVDLLLSEGQLPNFARIRREGAYGRLASSDPMLSPILWTTIATGKTPADHRITHFVATNPKNGDEIPVTSHMRRVKALWNVLSEQGRRVAVVGWWATWPAETVNGAIVSDHTCYHFLLPEGQQGAPDQLGVVHPPELWPEVAALVRRPHDLGPRDLADFVRVSPEELARPFRFEDDLAHFKWALATAQSYAKIGLHLWEKQHPDLLLSYIEATDTTSHLFGHLFRATGLSGELAAQQEHYGKAVEQMYRYADQIVGEYLAAMDANTTLIVLSDHGFQLGLAHDDPSTTRDMRRVSERFHRKEAILYLYGRGVRPRASIENAQLVDIAPTVLSLVGIAPARDMTGRVLDEALRFAPPDRTVASFESPGAAPEVAASDENVDPQIVERLAQLGYLDASSSKGDRNLAGILFEAGRHEEAAQIYARLVLREPDDGSLRASYAGALGALGRYDEALAQLDRAVALDPLNPEAYYNQGLIHERRNQRDAAVSAYRSALRYRPGYEPATAALQRLLGTTRIEEPPTPAEALATKLAERASEAARRGDYDTALNQLGEAERIAPKLALIQQYRSNVAFLRGDRAAAIAALERALKLEPDNALFRLNLERLRAADPGGARGSRRDRSSVRSTPPVRNRRGRRRNVRCVRVSSRR
jgi:tetratricopeptide (TPR) repeat protein